MENKLLAAAKAAMEWIGDEPCRRNDAGECQTHNVRPFNACCVGKLAAAIKDAETAPPSIERKAMIDYFLDACGKEARRRNAEELDHRYYTEDIQRFDFMDEEDAGFVIDTIFARIPPPGLAGIGRDQLAAMLWDLYPGLSSAAPRFADMPDTDPTKQGLREHADAILARIAKVKEAENDAI
jgi:hypothetical protein